MPHSRLIGDLSQVTQDYLKAIWMSQEWSDAKVTTKMLAEKLGVSPSTVSEGVRKLAEKNLVEHEPYGGVSLTDDGRTVAVAMVRRHRLLETFLVRELGYGWDEVHDDAEVLEHAVSDLLMRRIDTKLGHPQHDPHGDPIPAPDGSIPSAGSVRDTDLQPGHGGTITRIGEEDPEMLRYFEEVGIDLGRYISVTEKRPFAGTTTISVDDGEPIHLGDVASCAIFLDV